MLQKSTGVAAISAALRSPGGLPMLFSGIMAGFQGPNTRLHRRSVAQSCADHVVGRIIKQLYEFARVIQFSKDAAWGIVSPCKRQPIPSEVTHGR